MACLVKIGKLPGFDKKWYGTGHNVPVQIRRKPKKPFEEMRKSLRQRNRNIRIIKIHEVFVVVWPEQASGANREIWLPPKKFRIKSHSA